MFVCSLCPGTVEKAQAEGLFFSLGNYGMVKMAFPIEVPFCQSCHEVYTLVDEHEFDDLLWKSISENARDLVKLVEEKYGIWPSHTRGYLGYDNLSEIGPASFLLLKHLAVNGRGPLEALEKQTW